MSDETEEIAVAETHVEDAIEAVGEAAEIAGDKSDEETEVALEEISKVLAEARELLDKIHTDTEKAEATPEAETGSETSAEHTAADTPEVAVGEGKTEYRHVRRFGRKVKRKA